MVAVIIQVSGIGRLEKHADHLSGAASHGLVRVRARVRVRVRMQRLDDIIELSELYETVRKRVAYSVVYGEEAIVVSSGDGHRELCS